MLKDIIQIRDSIAILLENWEFDRVEFEFDRYKKYAEIHHDYVAYLFDTGQFDKCYSEASQLTDEVIGNIFATINKNVNRDILRKYSLGGIEEEKYSAMFLINSYLLRDGEIAPFFVFDVYTKLFRVSKPLTLYYFFARTLDYFLKKDRSYFFILESNKKFRYFTTLYNFAYGSGIVGAKRYFELYLCMCSKLRCSEDSFIKIPKVAVGFYGMRRGDWEGNLDVLIKGVVSPYNADCFIFTWDEISDFPGINTGQSHWGKRLLNKEMNDIIPEEINNKEKFCKYFPSTYEELTFNRSHMGSRSDFDKLRNKYGAIRSIDTENQLYLKPFMLVRRVTYYSQYRVIDQMIKYEEKNNFKYDYIFLLRIDVKMLHERLSVELDEADSNTFFELGWLNGTSGMENYLMSRSVAEKYLKLCCNFEVFKMIPEFAGAGVHSINARFCAANGISLVNRVNFTIFDTKALSGISIPNIILYLEKDLSRLNDTFSKEQYSAIKHFFDILYKKYKSLPIDATKKYSPTCASYAEPMELAVYVVKNSLEYRLGNMVINRWQQKEIFMFMRIFLGIFREFKQYHYERYYFDRQLAFNPNYRYLEIDKYLDYQEALKCKNHLSYKMGKVVVFAHKYRWVGGYLWLPFGLFRARKQFKINLANRK